MISFLQATFSTFRDGYLYGKEYVRCCQEKQDDLESLDSLSEGDYDEESAWSDWYASQGYDQVYYNYETEGYGQMADGYYANQALGANEPGMQYNANDHMKNVEFNQSEPLLQGEDPGEVLDQGPTVDQEDDRPMSVMSDQSDISLDDGDDMDRDGDNEEESDEEEEEGEEGEEEEEDNNAADQNSDGSDDNNSDDSDDDDSNDDSNDDGSDTDDANDPDSDDDSDDGESEDDDE